MTTAWNQTSGTSITAALSTVAAGQPLVGGWIDLVGGVWSAANLWSDTNTADFYLTSTAQSSPWNGGPLYRPQSEDAKSGRITASQRVDFNQTVYYMLRANRSTSSAGFTGYLVAVDGVKQSKPYVHIYAVVNGTLGTGVGSASVSPVAIPQTSNNTINGALINVDIQLTQVTDSTSQIVVSVTDSSGNSIGTFDTGASNAQINTAALQNVAGSLGICAYATTSGNSAGVKTIATYAAVSNAGAVVPWSGYTYSADKTQIDVNGTATLTVSPTPLTTTTFYNWDAKNQLQSYVTKLAALKAGTLTTQFRVCTAGDSTTVGVGSGSGSSGVTGCRLSGYPAQLSQQLEAAGLRVSYDNFFGSGNEPDADSRVSFVGSGGFGGVSSLGANAITLSAAGDGFVFTTGSTKTYNQVTVFYVDYGSKGTFTVQVDGQTVQTSTAIANSGVVKSQTFPITEGTVGKVTVMGSGSGQQFFCGVICEHSTKPYMSICNLGIAGGTTNQIVGPVDTAWQKYNSVTAMVDTKPDLVLLNTGINDGITDATAAQTILKQMSATLKALVAQGSPVILAVYQPIQANYYAAGIVAWRAALEAFSDAQNIPLLDLSNQFGNSPTSSGYVMFNNLHPTAATYGKIAAVWAERMLDPANDVIAQRKIVVTPSDNGGGGAFAPATVEFDAGSNAAKTLVYTGRSSGTKSITGTNSGSLTNPSALSLQVGASGATKYAISPASSTLVAGASTDVTFALDVVAAQDVTITPSDGGAGGAWGAATLKIPAGSLSGVLKYTAGSTAGTVTLSGTNDSSLTNGSARLTVSTAVVAPGAPGVSLMAGNGQVVVAVSAPSSNGGAPITGYPIYVGTSPGGEATKPVATLTAAGNYTLSGLTNGTPVYVTVGATNSAGTTISAEQTATPVAPSPSGTQVPVDNPAFLFSPGNWYGDKGRSGSLWRRTWNVGAYFVFTFVAGSNPAVTLHLGPSGTGANIAYFVNGVGVTTSANGDVSVSNLVANTTNTIEVFVYKTPQNNRWNQGTNNLVVSGATLDASSTVAVSASGSKGWVKVVGDSITEGINGDGNGKDSFLSSYTFQMLMGLRARGYEVCVSACGFSGYLVTGDSTKDVPAYYMVTGSSNGSGGAYSDGLSRWNKIAQGVSALDSAGHLSAYGDTNTEPAAIVVNYLTNEALIPSNASDSQAAMAQSMAAHRAAAPNAQLVQIVPFGFYYPSKYDPKWLTVFNSAVAAYRAAYPADKRVAVADIGPDMSLLLQSNANWYVNSDYVHPIERGHALVAPVVMAAVVKALEGGAGVSRSPNYGPVSGG